MADDRTPQGDKDPSGNTWLKSLLIWAGLILDLVLVVQLVGGGAAAPRHSIPYSDFLNTADDGSAKPVVIVNQSTPAHFPDTRAFRPPSA